MGRNIIHTVVLAALAGWSACALADDPPAMVGRLSSVQGQVTLIGDGEPVGATLNWPVTANNHINTASGARAEFRVGSTAVRVDGDSDLEITAMDDDVLRLRLNYGSVSIRVRNPDLLRNFELSTPQARVTLLEPGLLRVDAERQPDTSQVNVLAGGARVDGAGSSLVLRSGRAVDITPDEVRTGTARRDGFDQWAEERERYDSAGSATRFVSSGITGYEELDRNGSWTESVEYGPLWTPRNVALDWAPYRDGRWIWLAPWGWTWVDNAPWGYAPSHYGRWVLVNRRWCWAPGRPLGRPVWAPALVGWVGGTAGPRPGLGWYPLSPRDRYVPGYRVSPDYERRVSWTHNGKPFTPRSDWNGTRDGLTVLPREQFEGRRNVSVTRGAQVLPPAGFVRNVAPVAPPQPAGQPRPSTTLRTGWGDRDHDGIPDRYDRNDGRNERPGRVITAPAQPVPVPAQQPAGRISTLAPNQYGHPDAPAQTINPNDVRIELRPHNNPQWPGPVRPQNQPSSPTAPVLTVTPSLPPSSPAQPVAPVRERERTDRAYRPNEEQRELRPPAPQPVMRPAAPQPQSQPQPQRQPQSQPQPQSQSQSQSQSQPQPQPQPQRQVAPSPQAQPAQRDGGRNESRRDDKARDDNHGEHRRPNLQ